MCLDARYPFVLDRICGVFEEPLLPPAYWNTASCGSDVFDPALSIEEQFLSALQRADLGTFGVVRELQETGRV